MSESSLMFMKLSGARLGRIEGQAEVAEHKNWIELDNWDWSLEPRSEDDSIEPSIFSFTKLMDSASPTMLKAMETGDELSATIVVEDSSMSMFELTIHLQKARVTKYDLAAKTDDKTSSIDETWDFDYETIVFEYRADARSAPSVVRLRRPPGASTESSSKIEKEMSEFFKRGLDGATLDVIWNRVKDRSEKAAKSESKSEGADKARSQKAAGAKSKSEGSRR